MASSSISSVCDLVRRLPSPVESYDLDNMRPAPSATDVLLTQQSTEPCHLPVDVLHYDEHDEEIKLGNVTNPRFVKKPFWQLWANEIAFLFMSLAFLAAIVVILSVFDGIPQPHWAGGIAITLNSVIAIFSTLSRASLALVVAEVLSHLKWQWFDVTRPLSDLEILNRASTGLWGSIRLLISNIRHALVMISALLVILSAASSAFTQQAIRTSVCRVPIDTGEEATIPVAHYLNSVDAAVIYADHGFTDYHLGNSMRSELISALTVGDDGTNKLDFKCSTGDCSFETDPVGAAYSSIGLCKQCRDITSSIREWPGKNTTTTAYYYKGLNLTIEGMITEQNSISLQPGDWAYSSSITSDPGKDGVEMSEDSGSLNITYLTYTWAQCTINQTLTEGFYVWNCPKSDYPKIPDMVGTEGVLGVNCTFFPCIRSYSSRVENGILKETPISETRMKANMSAVEDPGALLEPCFINNQSYDRSNISQVPRTTGRNFTTLWTPKGSIEAPADCVYRMSYEISQALRQHLQDNFFGNNHCQRHDRSLYNLSRVSCPSEAWWLDSLYSQGFATFETVDNLLQNMSIAVSNRMRNLGTNSDWTAAEFATGKVWSSSVCTHVNWGWIAFPAALELITLGLLVLVVISTWKEQERPIWKSSILPLVFHGLRHEDQTSGSSILSNPREDTTLAPVDLASMEKVARDLPVRLVTTVGSSGFVVNSGIPEQLKGQTSVLQDHHEPDLDSLLETPLS